MLSQPEVVPEGFVELVHDAFVHLYDYGRLQTHPLLAALSSAGRHPEGNASPIELGRALRQALLDAVDSLRPRAGVSGASRAWRASRILELRFVGGADIGDVLTEMALSRSHYYREQHRAVAAAAALLWERWGVAGLWPLPGVEAAPSPASTSGPDPDWLETERLSLGTVAQDVDVSAVAAQVAALLEPLCRLQRVECRVEAAANLPPVSGDRVSLRHALLTFLGYAIGRLRDAEVTIHVGQVEDAVLVRIAGPASLPHDDVQAALEESRPFVEALGGRASAERSVSSREWEASFRLPVSTPPTLLVVDNDPDFVRLVARYLVLSPWRVIGARDVDAAITAVQDRRPRAVLLDVVLPNRDGWDLLAELRALDATRDTPVIVCSALNEGRIAASLGAAAYLRKPITQQELVAVLAPHL